MSVGRGSVNKVILVGRLGQDPELKYTPNGAAVTNFTLATNETWKDNEGNRQEKTEWHRIVMWRRLAEVAGEYLKKGSKIYVEGRLQTRSWQDKDGIKRYMTEVVADNMTMLDAKQSTGEAAPAAAPAPAAEEPPLPEPSEEDDLPF